MLEGFAAFILSHGRPDNVRTHKALRNAGYSGKIFVIVDDEDPSIDQYKINFPDEIIVFCKSDYDSAFDVGDNFKGRGSVVWARNASFEIAKDLGLTHFVQFDDDYGSFRIRHGVDSVRVTDMDKMIQSFLSFLTIEGVKTIAMAQGGDLFGNEIGRVRLKRKAMNSFFCRTDRPFSFHGRLNDDVNTYMVHGHRGGLFFTLMNVQLEQAQTQSQEGGLTEAYLDFGTYVKSFYSVMMCPSAVKVQVLKSTHRRLHHQITWNNAAPMILSESHNRSKRNG